MTKDNRIILDLNKVQYARFFYRNQYGHTTNTLPDKPSVRGMVFDPDAIRLTATTRESKETLITYAHRMKLLDVWVPIVQFQVQANHRVEYSSDKAVAMYKAWNQKIFKKK